MSATKQLECVGVVQALYLDAPVLQRQRVSTSEDDFGDERTIGRHVKRRGVSIDAADIEKDYGLFLGWKNDRWHVGIKSLAFMFGDERFEGGESYATLEELKSEWVLD